VAATNEGGGVWYEGGLRFECTRCGRCCTGGHGYVWVTESEAHRLAARLALDLDAFGRRYLRRIGDRYALLESPRDGACVFLAGELCTVYEDRPSQCRRFPFWDDHLASPEAWRRAAVECEGIRDDAALRDLKEIESRRRE
jgi:Fe-S-cluster containining protein